MIAYFMLMHIGSSGGITLLEFNEEEEEHQEAPQPIALKARSKLLRTYPSAWIISQLLLKGKPRSILSLPCFKKYHLSPLCLMH